MKLGDNMATVEACNIWEDACPRKIRPPRIGEIPRYSAVDEESPGGGSRRKRSTSPCGDSGLTEGMLELRLSTHGDVFSAKTSPVQKSPKCEEDSDSKVTECSRLSGIGRASGSPNNPVSAGKYDTSTQTETRIPSVTVMKEVERLHPDTEGPLKSSRKPEDRGNLVRIGSTPSQEIREVRKDSALYLEEAEDLRNLRESLKSRSPRSLTPRRESSGYASNLGTFDEDRRTSEVDLTVGSERRKSSTKRFTTENFLPRKINGNDENSNASDTTVISKENLFTLAEINSRKISSTSGLEMSDIQEVKDAEFDEHFKEKKTKSDKDEWSSDFSTSFETSDKKIGEIKTTVESTSEILSYAEVLAKSGIPPTKTGVNRSRILSRVESFDAGNIPSKISQISVNQKSGIVSQRKRIVHQYSTPNFSSMELESIIEKPQEKSPENQQINATQNDSVDVTSKEIHLTTRVTVEDTSETGDTISKEIPDLESEKNCTLSLNRCSAVNVGGKILPKSVKVYQLLSTQSEDRGDGVPNLSDRRISLQITRQEDDQLSVPLCEKLKSHGEKNTEVVAEGAAMLSVPGTETESSCVKHLTPTMATSSPPVRKLSTPGEVGSSSRRLPGDSGTVIRPIYPYCPYSPYGSPQGSPRTRRRPLRESRRVSIDNRQGALQLNQYKLLDNIGQGSYGIVKLAYNEEDKTHYAMKILSKKKLMKKAGIFGRMAPGRKGLADPLAKVYREIALLKKLDHPNVVKLVEVLDDPDEDNLYLVFELVEKGEVLQLPTEHPLDEETARSHFRDIVLGVEYLHYQRIVHRDIKPSNLLVDSEGHVKVADLGVSAELRAAGELLSGPAGTPAFAAPETTTPGAQYSGTLCDVWSMGVTLYSMVTGRVPWDGAGSIIGVQAAVRSEPLKFPDKPLLSECLRDLTKKMLEKEPSARLSLSDIKRHRWVTKDGTDILPNEIDNCRLPVTVTDEEVARVVTRVPKLDTLILIKTMLKQHSFQNPFLPKRSTKSISNDAMPGSSPSSGKIGSSRVSTSSNSRTEKFHEAGRSNSAPDTFECHPSDRQVSIESPLPPVTEALSQEIDLSKR